MDDKNQAPTGSTGSANMNKVAEKPVSRTTLVIEHDRVLDTTAQKELLDAVGAYGKVTKATHKVLRAHSTELI